MSNERGSPLSFIFFFSVSYDHTCGDSIMETKLQLHPDSSNQKLNPKSFVFDILDKIDLEKSIVHLPMTLVDDSINNKDYSNYIYDFVNCMLVEVMEELDLLEPVDFIQLVKEIEAQRAVGDILRILVTLTYIDPANNESVDIHEMVLKYDVYTKTYLILSYNYNYQSLVVIATEKYLEETSFQDVVEIHVMQ